MADRIQLIAGLGNPGPQYAETRHNVGAWFVESLGQRLNLTFKTEARFKTQIAKSETAHHVWYLSLPTTFMNESGLALRAIANFYKIDPKSILVVHDELDLPTGSIRLKTGGGLGGHNGLRSMTEHLGTENFHRLRIGIDHPGQKHLVTPYVLSKPNKSDFIKIQSAMDEALLLFPELLDLQNWPVLMNRLHSFQA